MKSTVRAEVSKKNPYWIDRRRYYELKYFCLQYPMWQELYLAASGRMKGNQHYERVSGGDICDPTSKTAIIRSYCLEQMALVEQTAIETDPELYCYILDGVTQGLSYVYLNTYLGMPCCKDTYYNRYRKFFYLLSQKRM